MFEFSPSFFRTCLACSRWTLLYLSISNNIAGNFPNKMGERRKFSLLFDPFRARFILGRWILLLSLFTSVSFFLDFKKKYGFVFRFQVEDIKNICLIEGQGGLTIQRMELLVLSMHPSTEDHKEAWDEDPSLTTGNSSADFNVSSSLWSPIRR
jgi:hypothetical protein